MSNEKKENPLRWLLDMHLLTLHQFSQNSKIHYSSLYPIYSGKRNPKRTLALRICRASKGKLTLADFGITE